MVCAGAPLLAFCFRGVITFSSYTKSVIATAIGLSIFEGLQIYLPRRTFDSLDILASFLGAVLSILLARSFFFMRKENEKTTASEVSGT